MEDRASSASREMYAIRLRARRVAHRDQVEIQIIRYKPNELHTIGAKIVRGGRYDGYAFLRLNQREDRLHRIRFVLNPWRKSLRSARSNDGVENTRCSFSVKKYESFISKIGKPNLF